MINLVEHMPDDHKVQLWSIWKEMTKRIKSLIGNVLEGIIADSCEGTILYT